MKVQGSILKDHGPFFEDPAHFLPKIKVQLLRSRPRFFAELFMIKVNSFLIATFIFSHTFIDHTFIDQGSFLTFGISFYHDFYFLSGHFLIFDLPFYQLQFALTIKDSDFSLSSFRDFSLPLLLSSGTTRTSYKKSTPLSKSFAPALPL